MPQRFNPAQFERELRAAQRRAQQNLQRQVNAYNRELDRVNRENKRRADDYNRKVASHNQKVIDDYNRKVASHNQKVIDDYNRDVARANAHNRRVDAQNAATVSELNRRLGSAPAQGPRYTGGEQELADRVHSAVTALDDREYDAFLGYARIDGTEVEEALRVELEHLGAAVWFDAVTIHPGKSQALQMDRGLRSARCGIALLTPAYPTGRFWTERELGALLHKETLIPVLHGVTFDDVAQYSGILPDLAGFETSRDSIPTIAEKIAAAILPRG
ncbi:MAG: TIR domain-containing protein [Actinobacteria bacterium]|nr:TIR domain-containing protein [Actinomycetota bacterium]